MEYNAPMSNEDIYDFAEEIDSLSKFEKDLDLEPEIPKGANLQTVQQQAQKASESVQKAKTKIESKIKSVPGLDRIIEVLEHDPELRTTSEPVSYEEIRHDHAYSIILDEIDTIIHKYRDGTVDLKESEGDILMMASMMTDLSKQLAMFQSQAADARSAEERQRIRAYVKAKLACIQERAKMTDTDAKELAKYMALEYAERAANLEYVEKYLYNCFHTLRNFLDLLNFVVGRERKIAEKGLQY